jgi:hypothetical protein
MGQWHLSRLLFLSNQWHRLGQSALLRLQVQLHPQVQLHQYHQLLLLRQLHL